jgi:hypothetical protein
MRRELQYTEKEINSFLNRADFDIVTEIQEEQMIPGDLSFTEFFRRYQKKSLRKFGKTLPLHSN